MPKVEYKKLEKEEKQIEKDIKLVVTSNIKQAVPELQVASDVPDGLNEKVREILKQASERAKLNGRRTLYARDL